MKTKGIITTMFIILFILSIGNMAQESKINKQENIIEQQRRTIQWQENQIKLYKDNLKDLVSNEGVR